MIFFDIAKPIAIIGVSRNTSKFSNYVYSDLLRKVFTVTPVNPHTTSINNNTCYTQIAELPKHIDKIIILTNKKYTDSLIL
ncbi:MAG TPA: CoA-binding protein [Bacteroidales bacterium]|nr:CoA-binding protein [Bacteroidales bacterium]HRS18608.1 CoA-binding protein [Bacteroidales bacterium]